MSITCRYVDVYPLVMKPGKIDVLVPAKDLEDARGVLAELEAAREVKVF